MDDHGAGQRSGGGRGSKPCFVLTLSVVLSLVPLVLSFFLSLETALGYDNLLGNGGFEAGTSGWTASPGSSFITVTEPVSCGNWAGALNRSGTTGEIYIQQAVDVLPGAAYTLTAWIYKDEPRFGYVRLGIDWLDSEYPDPGSGELTGDNKYYRTMTVGPVVAPPDASRARIRLVAWIREPSPEKPIYCDEFNLTSSMMPKGFIPFSLKKYPR